MEHWAYHFFSADVLDLETVKCQLFRQVKQTFQLLVLNGPETYIECKLQAFIHSLGFISP